jgi:hypothetical protein
MTEVGLHIRPAGMMRANCAAGVIAGSGFQRAAYFILLSARASAQERADETRASFLDLHKLQHDHDDD